MPAYALECLPVALCQFLKALNDGWMDVLINSVLVIPGCWKGDIQRL